MEVQVQVLYVKREQASWKFVPSPAAAAVQIQIMKSRSRAAATVDFCLL